MAIAVKGFIINEGRILILKRALDDVHKPGVWEIPGGRIDGEDMILGLEREIFEETGLDIEMKKEISLRNFVRDDNQEIEMHIFLCNALNFDVKLSEEHSSYEWIEIEKCKEKISKFFFPEVDMLIDIQ